MEEPAEGSLDAPETRTTVGRERASLLGSLQSFSGVVLSEADLVFLLNTREREQLDLAGADLSSISSASIDLSKVGLADADLSRAILPQSNLAGCMMRGARLHEADLHDADLTAAFLDDADLSGANLSRATMHRVSMRNAILTNARLRGAELTGSRLEYSSFANADLENVDFSDTIVIGIELTGSDLRGARLESAQGLTQVQLGSALTDSDTLAPSGLLVNQESPSEQVDLGRDSQEASPAVMETVRIAGYVSDSAAGEDRLGIDVEANALAAIIAAKDVLPPLSIGLFGDWGSGKSFFMKQVQQRVEVLARQSSRDVAMEGFYSRIVQVEFNAWHYVEANLWASIASRVFQELAAHVADLKNPAQTLMKEEIELQMNQLALARQSLTRAREKLEGVRRAQREPHLQVHESGTAKTVKDALKDHPEIVTDLRKTVRAEDEEELRQFLGAAGQLRAASRGIGTAWINLGMWAKVRVTVGVLLVLLAFLAIPVIVPILKSQVASVVVLIVAISAGLAAMVPYIIPVVTMASRAASVARHLMNAELRAEESRLKAAEKTAEAIVEQRESAVRGLQAQFDSTSRLQGLDAFVRERYGSSDYSKHLGTIALVQQDFECLSQHLKGTSKDLPSSVERVILYIDDLDRCPPKVVVTVLQAVHLLLAMPLFVVVVGVDSRWLVRSLEEQYAIQVRDAARSESNLTTSGPKVSAYNYLEKIFQIPYWIPRMDANGYRNLIDHLTPVSEAATRSASPVQADSLQPQARNGGDESISAAAPDQREASEEAALDRHREEVEVEIRPEMLDITAQEKALMGELGQFIPNPRSAKRLLNLYRVAKVTVPPADVTAFVGTPESPGDFEVVMLLLAVQIGFAESALDFFDALMSSSAETFKSFVQELLERRDRLRSPSWGHFSSALVGTEGTIADKDLSRFQHWAPRIGRLSFHLGHHILHGVDAEQSSNSPVADGAAGGKDIVDEDHPRTSAPP